MKSTLLIRSSLILLLTLLLAACSNDGPTSPEDEIRRFIDAGVAAAEDKDTGALKDMVAEDYNDQRNYDKNRLFTMVRGLFFRHKNIYLFHKIRDISITGTGSASAEVFVAMAGRQISDVTSLTSFRASIYRLELELAKDTEWQVLQARWSRASAQDMQ